MQPGLHSFVPKLVSICFGLDRGITHPLDFTHNAGISIEAGALFYNVLFV